MTWRPTPRPSQFVKSYPPIDAVLHSRGAGRVRRQPWQDKLASRDGCDAICEQLSSITDTTWELRPSSVGGGTAKFDPHGLLRSTHTSTCRGFALPRRATRMASRRGRANSVLTIAV